MARNIFDTQDLLNKYFKTKPETTVRKIRGQIDRDELYEFEKKIGKPLVDMNSMEIVDMFKTFNNKTYANKAYKMSYRTYDTLLSILRGFYDWYIDNYEVIKNPCNDKRIRGVNVLPLLSEETQVFTKDTVEELISEIRKSTVEEYADYEEAIIRMFYEGFAEAIDIVRCRADDVDHIKKTAVVNGRTIQLSDRLYELLIKLYNMEEFPAHRGSYLFLSYRGSFFKFQTRERYKGEFEERPPEYWAGHISRLFNREIKNKLNTNVNARTLYLCGFYNFMIDRVGQDETDRIITSMRNQDTAAALIGLAREYGVVEQNVTTLKKILLPFVSMPV